jgi:hypothetical protein
MAFTKAEGRENAEGAKGWHAAKNNAYRSMRPLGKVGTDNPLYFPNIAAFFTPAARAAALNALPKLSLAVYGAQATLMPSIAP